MNDTAALLQALLAYAWAPLLVAAGVIDWSLHRAQHIELTAGFAESALHLLMCAMVGSAILAALLLEPTAGLLALLIAAVLLHDLTYLADLRVALASRRIGIAEQWVHGFQHLLPWAGLSCVMALSPEQTVALLHLPPGLLGDGAAQAADWSLRFKADPPWTYTLVLVAVSLVLNVLPFIEEAWRGWQVRQRAGAAA